MFAGDSSAILAGDADNLVIGIPYPTLALEYLTQNQVFPLERISQLLGIEGSCKSGLAAEVGRWFINAGGFVTLLEHESKYSPDWVPSIIGWDLCNHFATIRCDSMDDWQQKLSKVVDAVKSKMIGTAAAKGPGAVYPVLLIVDSIMGKALAETQGRVDAAGFAGRDFPAEAKSLTAYMRCFPQKIVNWPFHLVMVNHLRPKKDQQSYSIDRDRAGGKGKEFQETFEFEITRIKNLKPTVSCAGVDLKIEAYKNALGENRRSIRVECRWSEEPIPSDPENWRQVTVWDWDAATIRLLLALGDEHKTRAKNIVDLTQQRAGTVSSRRLGIKPDAPATFAEAGALIHQDETLMHELRRVFGIKLRKALVPGSNYHIMRGTKKAELASLYKAEVARMAALKKKKPT